MVLTFLKRFYLFSGHIALGKDSVFNKAVYLQTATMLLYKFVFTFSHFSFFFLFNIYFSALLRKEDLNYMSKNFR